LPQTLGDNKNTDTAACTTKRGKRGKKG